MKPMKVSRSPRVHRGPLPWLAVALGGILSAAPATQLRVAQFGAVGDGIADDGPAIQRAVAAVSNAKGPVTLAFEPKTYRIDRLPDGLLMNFHGLKDLTVQGNGAVLRNHAKNGTVQLRGCTNVKVTGFVLESEPLSFSQGTLVRVDPQAGTVEVALDAGHLNWDEELKAKRLESLSIGMFMDAVEPRKKTGPNGGDFFRTEATATLSPGRLRITLDPKQRNQLLDLVPGDRLVQTFNHGGHGPNFAMMSCDGCAFEDLTVYSANYGMTFAISGSETQVALRRITIRPKPGTGRLLATPHDGMHCKHNRVGPLIEHCHFEGLLDDSINISATPYWVKKVEGPKTCVVSSGPPRVGDRLLAFNPSQEAVPTYRVTAVSALPEPANGRTWYRITFAEDIRDFVLQATANEFPGGADKMKVTGLYNLDACGSGFIIRSNTFGPQRRFPILARTSGTIAGNVMYGCGGSAMNLGNETGSFYEGPFPQDLLIEGNRISNVLGTAITLYSSSLLREPLAHSVVLRGNRIEAGTRGAFHANCASNIEFTDNRVTLSPGVSSQAPALLFENCKKVSLGGNTFADPRGILPLVVGRETWPSDLTLGKNTFTAPKGTPEISLDEPPPSGLLMPKKVAGVTVSSGNGEEIPVEKSPWSQICAWKGKVTVNGESHYAYEVHPPFGKDVTASSIFFGGATDLAGIQEIRFQLAKRASGGDGVRVSLNISHDERPGEWTRAFEVDVRETAWSAHRVDVSAWTGKKVRWRFEVSSRRETSFDSTLIGDIRRL